MLLLSAVPAAAAEWPVLFVHGFCSSAETWNETIPQLSTRRFGTDVPRVYESSIGKAASRTQVAAGTKTFRIDFSDLSGGFDLLAVANVPTVRKAGELKSVIDAIKLFTGAPKVIIVGHSLGGLAARAYIQGIGQNRQGATIAYSGDVAALIMISTPNQGSVLANISGRPGSEACVIADTANLRDLQPSSELLAQLNSRPWPAGTAVDSIVSNNAGRDSDDVVTVESQDLTALAQFRSLPEAKRWLQTFERNGILHLRVHNEATTVALFTGIIGDVDNGATARGQQVKRVLAVESRHRKAHANRRIRSHPCGVGPLSPNTTSCAAAGDRARRRVRAALWRSPVFLPWRRRRHGRLEPVRYPRRRAS